MRQYLSIKDNYADTILFFRMGDFYEMFFEDAELASQTLEITLTSRNKHEQSPVPMCGVPVKAAQGYIARLVEKGHKVAVCDQVEHPSEAKGIVKREVVRVITPGMIVDDALLNQKTNNYILAICYRKQRYGLAYFDLSTGSFRVTETSRLTQYIAEISRIAPKELLVATPTEPNEIEEQIQKALPNTPCTRLEENHFLNGPKKLRAQFNVLSLESFGCENMPAATNAAGAVIDYVAQTQKQAITHLTGISTYHLEDYLFLDDLTYRNLELEYNLRYGRRQGTLLSVLDKTVTAMGGRLLKQWLKYPLRNPAGIDQRLQAVSESKTQISIRRSLRAHLKAISDLERLGSKIALGQANARDMLALKQSLQTLPALWSELDGLTALLFERHFDTSALVKLAEHLEKGLQQDPPPTITEGGIIKDNYNTELDELIEISRDGKHWLAQLEAREREATGITTLKVRFNKVFGYYIEISKAQAETVPSHYIRKQTLVNAERFITDELKAFEAKVLGAEERRAALEYQLFQNLRDLVIAEHPLIQDTAHYLAQLDCLLNLAEIADQNDYCQPVITTDGQYVIEEGRHPVIEKMLSGERFVPNSVRMDCEYQQILLITGPNMAGKSTLLRQVALIVLMAQMGSFVPASSAILSITDRIFSRVGALDNLAQGQSTFMVEMQETANILHNASPDSLVIMDEIGRGTSTFDGMSIAWAVAEALHDIASQGVKALFATHYHELTDLARTKPRLKNYSIAVKEWNDEIIFLRKLVEGGTNRSYGIQVARLAGLPAMVIQRAKRILHHVENRNVPSGSAMAFEEGLPSPENHPRQLELVTAPDRWIQEKLQQLDISTMTPLEAINCLHELQQKAKAM